MSRRPVVDEQPESEFLRSVREAFARRLAAKTLTDKRAIEREIAELIHANRQRSAWDGARDAEAGKATTDVPRDTSVDSSCHTLGVQSDQLPDRKQLAARDVE